MCQKIYEIILLIKDSLGRQQNSAENIIGNNPVLKKLQNSEQKEEHVVCTIPSIRRIFVEAEEKYREYIVSFNIHIYRYKPLLSGI